MPVEFGIWRVGAKPEKVSLTGFGRERDLEDVLWSDISILDPELMLIGRQVATDFQKLIDILAITADGNLVIVELKRDQTPRDVVAQTLDYASWVKRLSHENIVQIFTKTFPEQSFEAAFSAKFGINPPEDLNETHQIVIVATELDNSTERIVNYLSEDYGVPINVVFVRTFKHGAETFLARSWLISPDKAESNSERSLVREKTKEAWNGQDYYVNIQEEPERSWDDCVKYGFISAGGGRKYSQLLQPLQPGHRVFAYIPKNGNVKGYVGVGIVTEPSVPVDKFIVNGTPILQLPLAATDMGKYANDPALAEHLVRVKWEKTFPRDKAIWEPGMFTNPNCACKLRNKFTLEKLISAFGLEK